MVNQPREKQKTLKELRNKNSMSLLQKSEKPNELLSLCLCSRDEIFYEGYEKVHEQRSDKSQEIYYNFLLHTLQQSSFFLDLGIANCQHDHMRRNSFSSSCRIP